jgi:hypothetical protein
MTNQSATLFYKKRRIYLLHYCKIWTLIFILYSTYTDMIHSLCSNLENAGCCCWPYQFIHYPQTITETESTCGTF